MGSSVLILTIYSEAWAVVHSLTASLRCKNWVRRFLGPWTDRWYRLAYVKNPRLKPEACS